MPDKEKWKKAELRGIVNRLDSAIKTLAVEMGMIKLELDRFLGTEPDEDGEPEVKPEEKYNPLKD